MLKRILLLTLFIGLLNTYAVLANHPSPLPDTINTPTGGYVVNYTDNNPYVPPAGAGSDLNYFPAAQAQFIANALSNSNAAVAGTPNGYHNGYVNLSFSAPDFGSATRNIYVFDCSMHGGCDSGNAPSDRINFPAQGYISQSEACIRLVAGHELFHHVQYSYITFGQWSAWGTMPVEGTARLMQDKIYSDLDANAGCITYQAETNGFLGSPNQTIWNASYASALFWNYLSEQLGTTAVEPQRGVDFIRRFWEHAGDNDPDVVGTIRQTITDYDTNATLEGMFHQFTIANYTKNLNVAAIPDGLKYRYRDEIPGTTDVYNAVARAWSGNITPSTPRGPVTDVVVRWGANYYEANLNDCFGVAGVLSDGQRAAYSLVAIRTNATDRILTGVGTHFARSILIRRNEANPYTRLGVTVAGLDDPASYNYTIACGMPKLSIIEPNSTLPAYVGTKATPDRFLVRLNVTGLTALGDPSVEGLAPTDFTAFVGDPAVAANAAPVLSGAYVQGQYWLVVQAPVKVGGGDIYPLTVFLGDFTSATQADSVIYNTKKLDQVLVIDRSGSMAGPAGASKIVAARNAGSLFVDAARSTDKIGVVSFNGDNTEVNDDATLNTMLLTVTDAQRTAAKAAISALAAAGFTSIGDGLQKGAAEFPIRGTFATEGVNAEKWLVLLSDGMENEGAYWNAVRVGIQAAGIKVNTIALGPYTDQALLQQIANQTGGMYYYVDVPPDAAAGASDIASIEATGALDNRLSDAFVLSSNLIQKHERIWESSGTAAAPVVHTVNVGEGGITEGMWVFNWTGGGLNVSIKRPDNSVVTNGVAGAKVYTTASHTVAQVGNLQPGTWTITLTPTSGTPNWVGFLSGKDQQGAQLKLAFGQYAGIGAPGLFMRGLPMPIIISLTDAKGVVLGAKVYATVEHPDGTNLRLPLLDDGAHNDGNPNDGIYANLYTRTTVASPTNYTDTTATAIRGSYNVQVNADGKDNFGDAFTRIRKGAFQIFEGYGRDKQDPDPDKDGMPTRYELLHDCLNPAIYDADGDPDQDNIKTGDEWAAGTDPCYPDTDRGGENDRSELGRGANPFDPQDDALPRPIDVEVMQLQPDHLPPLNLKSGVNLIRYPINKAYTKVRILRSNSPSGPFAQIAEFDALAKGGLYEDGGLPNGMTFYYQVQGVDLNGNASAPSHVFSGTPSVMPNQPIGHILIANGKPKVFSKSVTIGLGVDDTSTVAAMILSNDPSFAGASWEAFAPTRTWALTPNSMGYAIVYAKFRNVAGKESAVYVDDILVSSLSPGIIKGILTLKLLGVLDTSSTLDPNALPGVAGIMVTSPSHPSLPAIFTDNTGAFLWNDLEPGTYSLLFQKPGYIPLRLDGIVLAAGAVVDLNIQNSLQLIPYFKFYLPLTLR